MAEIRADRVLETTVSGGTGPVTLDGAETGYRAFSDVMNNGDTCYYVIEAIDENGVPTGDWEAGLGTYDDGDNALVRTTVHDGSNGVSHVDFDDGEVNLVDVIGGTGSSNSNYGPANGGASAFDNNLSTRYANAGGDIPGAWVKFAFTSPVEIGKVVILMGPWNNEWPTEFNVQYSDDDSTWTTAWSETGLSWTTGEEKTFASPDALGDYGEHAYWRLVWQASPSGYVTITEIDFYSFGVPVTKRVMLALTKEAIDAIVDNAGGGAPALREARYWGIFNMQSRNGQALVMKEVGFCEVASGSAETPSASTYLLGSGNELNPGTSGNYDQNIGAGQAHWFRWDFGADIIPVEFYIRARDDYGGAADQLPSTWEVWASDDGIVWDLIARYLVAPSWSGGQDTVHRFALPEV